MIPCQHLTKSDMTYCQHSKRALRYAGWSCLMAIVCCIHAVLPWFFTETFSRSVLRLAYKLREEEKKRCEKSEDWF